MRKIIVVLGLPVLILASLVWRAFSYDECVAPPFVSAGAPPLVMLVMERDHKLYYEAYNDTIDLDGDGRLDVGYKDSIEYFGLFNSNHCYTYDSTGTAKFVPSRLTPNYDAHRTDSPPPNVNHYCGGNNEWSGNFLNWLSMTRMDVIKKVLYGGHRSTDSASETVLEGVYIPRDAHSWGKEYSGADTRNLTPYNTPNAGTRHLFCVTSDNADSPHQIKVALNDSHRMWEWASTERPVCTGPDGSGDVGSRADISRFFVRVKACSLNPELDEMYCKLYPGGGTTYKPVGLLQKYAEGTGSKVCSKNWKTCNSDSDCSAAEGLCVENTGMYLGMMSGSYTKNTSGGVLRKNIWSILDEINYQSGSFQSSENVQGNIILTLDRMKTIDFDYSDSKYTGGWLTSRAMQEGEFKMWGNPIGEMMYETLRYFAGKSSPTAAYTYSGSQDSSVNLTKPDWGISRGSTTHRPYDIFPGCAKPFMLVISDVNVNFDSDQLPGSSFGTFTETDGLSNINVTTLADTIGTTESLAGNNFFIGQSGTNTDFTCSSKTIANLSSIRGLCPEEPTKQGSFSSAAVAYYGKTMFNDNTGKPDVTTLAVALSSPVPDINVKVGGNNVRVVPVGKSVSGCQNVHTNCFAKCTTTSRDANGLLHISGCSSDAYCPSNQIVDFYPENIQYDGDNNLTSAQFRINFEDVEQGADHDMDAIVQYTVEPVGSTQVRVTLNSSVLAAGCIDQVLGFVISGTTADGLYLVVKDDNVSNTAGGETPEAVSGLLKTWTKTFTLSGTTAGVLHDPLWYAAKWGGFTDTDGSKKPDRAKKWDRDNDGVPDNYFFVANPLELYDALEKAFIAILSRGGSAGAVATVTQQVQGQDMIVRGAFTSYEDDPKNFVWKGHLETYWPYQGCSDYSNTSETDCEKYSGCTWYPSVAGGTCSGLLYSFQKDENRDKFCFQHHDHCWEAEEHLPAADSRTIFTMLNGQKTTFDTTNICTAADPLALGGDASYTTADCSSMIGWVRGTDGWDKARNRDGWTLGDIVYSTPVVVQQPSLSAVPVGAVGDCNTACTDTCDCTSPTNNCRKECFYCFRECQKTRKRMVYVGANDGMVHAFVGGIWDGTQWVTAPTGTLPIGTPTNPEIGKELWAYIPSNILSKLKELARPTYGGTETGDCTHRFLVDLSPQTWEVFIDPDGPGSEPRQWRTVLIGGERAGGDNYFALDVTDPDNPKVLWEFPVLRNMVQMAGTGSPYSVQTPFRNKSVYDQVKGLPSSWAVPYVGKLKLDGISFLAADPVSPLDAGNPALSPINHDATDLSGWFAVVPTAPKIFQLTDLPGSLTQDQKVATLRPNLLMIDIEKGINIFQYVWPLFQTTQSSKWPTEQNGTSYIPYAPTSPTVLDIWNSYGGIGNDGYLDHIYFGDLNGKFYGLKFNLDDANKGMEIDFWQTREIPAAEVASNVYRSDHEPITVPPTAAFDRNYNLRLYFGTGKYDNIKGASTDKTDSSTMSFYALKDSNARPTIDATATVTGTSSISVSSSATNGFRWNDFGVDVNAEHCNPLPVYSPTCTWVKVGGGEDCCEATNPDCATPCWNCIYSLNDDGERVVDSALIAGGLVFFTTFVPNTEPCAAGGYAYLYVIDYLCRDMGSDTQYDPLRNSGFIRDASFNFQAMQTGHYGKVASGTKTVGYVTKIGVGMPSRPVLDSSGQYVFVQTSDAQIHKIKVELPEKPLYLKGWKEE